jgi:PAS domain S-box-containing protein
MDVPTSAVSPFLADGGEVGALMRTHDWSRFPLGAPEAWPQSLSTVVSLMLNSKFPMFVAWGEGQEFLYNDSYAEILGAKHPLALGRRFKDVWSEIWDDISPIVAMAMDGKASYFENLPLTMHRKGYDEQTWFTFSYSPVRDESGRVAGVFCACTETTGQVLAERHQAEELQRSKQIFQQAPGFIAVIRGTQHVFELANDAYIQLIGHRDIIGKPVADALPELRGQGFVDLLDNVFTAGEPFLGRALPVMLQREPGAALEQRYVDFVYQPVRDAFGEVSSIFVQGNDVTEAMRATQALRESEAQLRLLANTIPQMAWIANPDGWIHWYNDRWYEYTGSTLEQMEGWQWTSVHDPERLAEVVTEWKRSLETGMPFESTFALRSASGEYRSFYTRVAPLHDSAGNLVQWFGTNTDVTALELAQNELRTANRRKDEFLAMLAHELRNPLAPISTAAELLKFAGLDQDRIRQTSNIIARQVAHMKKLVDDLLDVSRVTRGLVSLQEEVCDVGLLVADALEQSRSLVELKQHHLKVDLPAQPCFVKGDTTRLIQVFSNILNNAAKYTPAHGHISLQLRAEDELVRVAVQDDGIGIAPALQPHIFDLFTQGERSPDRSQGGLGLGLALAKSLVELHGGSVAVHSQGLGLGSRFVVTLPRVVPAESAVQAPLSGDGMQAAAGGVRLMVVDDNVDAAETLSALLEMLGHEVGIAHTAQDALDAARTSAPRMLFLDIGLPDMDGHELARRLRATPATAGAVLVAVTGYGQPEDRERAMRAGFDHHLVKPVQFADIQALLNALV